MFDCDHALKYREVREVMQNCVTFCHKRNKRGKIATNGQKYPHVILHVGEITGKTNKFSPQG